MPHQAVATAQAQTLRDWALEWTHDGREGSSEVSFLLNRAAAQIERSLNPHFGAQSVTAESGPAQIDGAAQVMPEPQTETRPEG